MIGTKLGSYKIVEALGEGGMGVVYVGEHSVLGRRAAIKVLHPDLARRPDTVKRFLHEARSATRVKHPGLVDVFDFGTDDAGNAYLIMELLDGESLAARLKREATPAVTWSVMVARQIALAVDAVHAQGIVHRDLKPDNVFLCKDEAVAGGERVKVLDFGLAKAAADDRGTSIRTRTGTVMGTPLYMSPEQCRGAGTPLDARSDVYSLGCILYEMVCGRPPFVHEGLGDLLVAHIHDQPTTPTSHGAAVPADLEVIILRMLAKKPDERPQTMREVIHALEATDAGQLTTSGAFSRGTGVAGPSTLRSVASGARLGAQTTLAGAASQMVDEEPAARRGRMVVVGLVAAAALGATVWAFTRETKAPTQATTAPAAAPAPAPEPPAEPPPSEPEAPPSDSVKLGVATDPLGADVFRKADNVLQCRTPCVVDAKRGPGEAVYVLRLDGYEPQEIRLPVSANSNFSYVLVKQQRRVRTPAPKPEEPPPKVKPREKIKNGTVDPYPD